MYLWCNVTTVIVLGIPGYYPISGVVRVDGCVYQTSTHKSADFGKTDTVKIVRPKESNVTN